jgi:hypothetical protein
LRGVEQWNKACDTLQREIQAFIAAWNREQPLESHPLRLMVEITS